MQLEIGHALEDWNFLCTIMLCSFLLPCWNKWERKKFIHIFYLFLFFVCFISFYFSGQMLTCYIFSVSQAKTHCMLDFSFWSNPIMKQVVRVLQGNPSLVTALAAIILVFLVHPALGLFVLLLSHSLCCHSMLCWYGSSLNSFLDCSYDVWINQGNKFVAYSWICITIC